MFSVISRLTCFSRSSILPLVAPAASPPAARIVPSVLENGDVVGSHSRNRGGDDLPDGSGGRHLGAVGAMTTEAEGG